MGPMQDSLGQSSKEREDRAHSNVRPLVLRQRKLPLIGPKVTLLTVSRTKNVHQPIHRRKKDPKDSGWLEVDEFGWQPTIFPFAAKPGPRDAAAELNSHLPADILELFITDELLQHIVHHTNLYANQSMQKQTDKNCCARVNSLQRVFQIVWTENGKMCFLKEGRGGKGPSCPSSQRHPTKSRRHWTFCTDSKTSLREACVPTQTRLVFLFVDNARP
ncbi:uncharacterized protein LOC144023578 [Festucalex cinctus]